MRYFIFAIFLLGGIVITKAIWDQVNKPDPKSSRIACQSEVVTFERLYAPTLVATTQKALRAGKYELSSTELHAKHMPSKLFEFVNKEEVEKLSEELIATHAKNESSNSEVSIKLTIYENDKLDPGKKTPKSKLYAGYLIYDLYLDQKNVYKIQIDFMDMQGKDIEKRAACAIDSIMSL